MAAARFCLIDLYETVLSHDFMAHRVELPAYAGVPEDEWNRAFNALADQIIDGRLSMAEAYDSVLRSCDADATTELVAGLVDLDRHLLVTQACLHEDTVPFLRSLRRRGVKTALVSNCAGNTRSLLDELGLLDLVDSAVLSCEIGWTKPAPMIYERALDLLGGDATEAVFIDDQLPYCKGALTLGIRAVCIDRSARLADAQDVPVAKDLLHANRLIWGE
jgi:HAD superfamily hydrolase (TIGR01509 family)